MPFIYAINITSNIPQKTSRHAMTMQTRRLIPLQAYHIFPYNNAVVDRSLMHSSILLLLCSSSRLSFPSFSSSSSLFHLFLLYFYIPALFLFIFFPFALRCSPSLFFSYDTMRSPLNSTFVSFALLFTDVIIPSSRCLFLEISNLQLIFHNKFQKRPSHLYGRNGSRITETSK